MGRNLQCGPSLFMRSSGGEHEQNFIRDCTGLICKQ
jgi:hypothetical protein